MYRLDTVPTAAPMRGELPPERRVELRVTEGEGGFNMVRGNEARLQTGVYLLWARWYRDPDGEVRAHWHLSPNSEPLLTRVRDAIGMIDPNAPRETVIRN